VIYQVVVQIADLAGEAMLDGYRCILSKYNDNVRVKFEGGEDLGPQHPELAKAVQNALFEALILDGVTVAVAEGEILSRDGLAALPTGELAFPAMLAAFDCLFLNEDLSGKPLGERREILKAAIHDMRSPLVRLSPVREFSTRKELEILNHWAASRPSSTGLMVKDLSKPRHCGSSDDWAFLKAG
jgi:ATP-dependent DNA ligase